MFKREDIVVNKKGQVCKVIDILDNYDVGLGKNTYYVLVPYFNEKNDSIKYYIPADSKGIIRSALSKSEIINLIDRLPQIKEIWITNPKVRKTKFRELYDSGNPVEIFRLIKSFEKKKKELEKENKFLSFTDESFLREIKTNIYNEFSVGLNITSNDVENFILERLGQEI